MKNIIDDLYLGDINPNENTRIVNSEYLGLMKKAVAIESELDKTLEPNFKDLFDDFANKIGYANAIEARLRFIEGFRLGAQIMLDVMTSPELK